jgi:arylsulfatase
VWARPYTVLRIPRLFNLRRDPFERADHDSDFYTQFFIDHMFVMVPAQAFVAQFLQTFQEFPPRQKPASFTIDQVVEKLAPPSN